MKLAAMIWRKSAQRKEGQMTKQEALMTAQKIFMQKAQAMQNNQ
jgi:hypothetical protein